MVEYIDLLICGEKETRNEVKIVKRGCGIKQRNTVKMIHKDKDRYRKGKKPKGRKIRDNKREREGERKCEGER